MTTRTFWFLLIVATLVSIAIGTVVAVMYHWVWGVLAYFVSDFILDGILISYSMNKIK